MGKQVLQCECCGLHFLDDMSFHKYCSKCAEFLTNNAIVPKYKIGQDVFVFDWSGQLRCGKVCVIHTIQEKNVIEPTILYVVDFYGGYSEDDTEDDLFEEKDVFATKEEAEKK